MGDALVGNTFSRRISPKTSKISFHTVNLCEMKISMEWKERRLVAATALKPCWLLKRVSIARLVAWFPQASLLWLAATADGSETPCVCARPSYQRKQSRSAAPRAWPLILPTVRLPDDRLGLKLGLKLELSPQKSQHKLCGVWILVKSITDAKFEPSEVRFLILMPQNCNYIQRECQNIDLLYFILKLSARPPFQVQKEVLRQN